MAALSSQWQCDVCMVIVEVAGIGKPLGWDDRARMSYNRHTGNGYWVEVNITFTICERCGQLGGDDLEKVKKLYWDTRS